MNFKRLIRLDFLPGSVDCGLLLLRVWLGLTMLLLHGMDKLKNFGGIVKMMGDNMNVPAPLAAAAILAESVGAILVAIGFATRWAALGLASTMGVAFFVAHKAVLNPAAPPPGSGEMAFIYLAGFVAILIAGPGRWSVDAKLLR